MIIQNLIKKHKITSIILIIFSLNSYSQNLVPNGNFESYDLCPDHWCQISYCQYWDSFGQNPEYYNTCGGGEASPPFCGGLGFQYPHSGNAYVGLYIFNRTVTNDREFIGTQLTSQLIFKQKYYISFYISLGGSNSYQTTIASNNMGVKFSTIPYSESNPAPIDNFAHFYANTIISDTVNWVKISGSFVADSAYNYLIMGNFFNDSLTDTLNLSTISNLVAYYFIDDICVSTDSLYCENWLGIDKNNDKNKEISIYPNPATNMLNVESSQEFSGTLVIYNSLGKPVKSLTATGTKITLPTEDLPSGLYILKINDNKIRFSVVK